MYSEMSILVIKPTLKCTANCLGCVNRRQQHVSAMRKGRQVSTEEWKCVIGEAACLGAKELLISGGEPTLYGNLIDLIRHGKEVGLQVGLATNGSSNNEAYLQELLKAGLDSIYVSLYSHLAEVHNRIRRSKNLWNKVTETIRILAKLSDRYPRFRLITMSIIMKENYRSLDKLIEFHRNLGSHQITLAYLEGDFEKKNLLTEEQIMELKTEAIPKAIDYCMSLDPRIRDCAIHALKEMYSDEVGTISDLAQGIYWKKNYCEESKGFALIWSNGMVVPCFMCEYTTEPVMGNIFERSLTELWPSDGWNDFRKNLHQKCELCPLHLHKGLPLKYVESGQAFRNNDILRRIYYSRKFQPFRPAAKKIIELCRLYL